MSSWRHDQRGNNKVRRVDPPTPKLNNAGGFAPLSGWSGRYNWPALALRPCGPAISRFDQRAMPLGQGMEFSYQLVRSTRRPIFLAFSTLLKPPKEFQ